MENQVTDKNIETPIEASENKMNAVSGKPYTRYVEFRLTKGESLNSWMAWMRANEGSEWAKLRPAETTFESAQMAIYDEMCAWAFPRS